MRYLYMAHFEYGKSYTWEAIPIARPDFSPERKNEESMTQYKERRKQIKLYQKAMKNGINLLIKS